MSGQRVMEVVEAGVIATRRSKLVLRQATTSQAARGVVVLVEIYDQDDNFTSGIYLDASSAQDLATELETYGGVTE
jgi:hypothetical protein